MQLSPDTINASYQIRSYQPGRILVNDRWIEHSLIISPERLIEDWPAQRMEELTASHLLPILDLKPTIVLLGSGVTLRFPAAELLMPFYSQKIGVEVMDTAAACRTYSVLVAEGRSVVAGLIV